MPRSTRSFLGFSLRKSSSNSVPTLSEPQSNILSDTRTDGSGSDVYGSNARARKVLGDPDPVVAHKKEKKLQKQRDLKPKRSFMTITASETSYAGSRVGDDSRSMAETSAAGGVRPVKGGLRLRPSSPLLGDSYKTKGAQTEEMTDVPPRSLHQFGSSSTLRSYYDASKAPPAISQQTSESSRRDFALRRGLPQVISPPLSRHKEDRMEQSGLRKRITVASGNGSRTRLEEPDLTKLFPQPQGQKEVLLSPHRLVSSPSTASALSEDPFALPHLPENVPRKDARGGNESKTTLLTVKQQRSSSTLGSAYDYSTAKLNQRRPKKGIKNWFDDFDEDDDDGFGRVKEDEPPLLDRQEKSFRARRSHAPEPLMASPDLEEKLVVPHQSRSSQRWSKASIAIKSAIRPVTPKRSNSNFSSTTTDAKARPKSVGRQSMASSKKSGSNTQMEQANLQKESVLALTSSDDESEEENVRNGLGKPSQKAEQSHRDSVIKAYDSDETVEICDAETVTAKRSPAAKFHKPKPSAAAFSFKSSSTVDVRSPHRTSFLAVPSGKTQTTITRRIHTVEEDTVSEMSEDPQADAMSSTSWSTYTNSRRRSSKLSTGRSNRMSRIMAVTREEQDLLEAMRLRRSKHEDSYREGYESALAQKQAQARDQAATALQLPSRPRTSSEATRSSSTFLQLSGGGSGAEPFPLTRPTTSDTCVDSEILATSHHLPFLAKPTQLSPLVQHLPEQFQSPRTSMIISENPTTPSTSRTSPITPTVPFPLPQSSKATKHGSFFSQTSDASESKRHSRTRTSSSHAIMLDAVDDAVDNMMDEQELPVWAMAGWNERAGLGLVH